MGEQMLTSENTVETETGEHCDGEQHLSAPDHAVLARGALLWGVRWVVSVADGWS